jgi:prepilin-type N-terminal cleavage/methylation domain-containing protein
VIRFRTQTSGFTLLELLIVIAMISLLGATPFMLIERTDTTRVRLEARMAAAEQEGRALRQWRADVERAVAVAVDDDGRRMELALLDGDEPVTVVYEPGENGSLLRREPDAAALPLEILRDVADTRFIAREDGWEIAWTAVFNDGFVRFEWPGGGHAAPLLRPAADRGAR